MAVAGKLDQPITLQRIAQVPDGLGGIEQQWANLPLNASVWAAVTPRMGRESMVEGRTTATYVVTFTIYNRDDISELDRIVWCGEAYNIRNLMRRGGRVLMLDIDAERGVAP